MNATAPTAEATTLPPEHLELPGAAPPKHHHPHARPDGGPFTAADFERLARIARATTYAATSGAG
ncbi:hypothetical protein [Streptomyces sp. NPDC059129]|uniref:hypothetical protein n=1 Tax=unclassified Streptomyces TaxID=2593676 RepID=UPI00368905BF